MRNHKQQILKSIGILLIKEIGLVMAGILLGTISLTLVHFIPQGRMTGHVQESASILYEEGLHPQVWQGINETSLDNTTDSLMINTAYTQSGDAVKDILLDTYVKVKDKHVVNSLYEIMCSGNQDYNIETYGRYWHGYQVFLRPLLLVMNITEIRQLNTFFQLCAVTILLCLLVRRNRNDLVVPIAVMYFFLCPVSMFSSLQFSTSFYVMMFTLIVLNISWGGYTINDEKNLCLVFTLSGILTAFFDLLTYPFITLGVPLITHFAIKNKECSDNRMQTYAKELCSSTIAWGIGYVGMWMGKWVIASLFTDENIIYDAVKQIKFRSGNTYKEETYTYIGTIKNNINSCNKTVSRDNKPFQYPCMVHDVARAGNQCIWNGGDSVYGFEYMYG